MQPHTQARHNTSARQPYSSILVSPFRVANGLVVLVDEEVPVQALTGGQDAVYHCACQPLQHG